MMDDINYSYSNMNTMFIIITVIECTVYIFIEYL